MSESVTVRLESPLVQMAPHRCWECGRWWAYETFRAGTPECPVCSGATIKRLRDEITHLERAAAALRGALKRKAGKRG